MPQPCSVPTTVSAAAAGWAQPLAQPEMWMAAISRDGGSCRAISVASARAAINPDAQAGVPGQATMRRRGSSARTMKPSRSAAVVSAAARSVRDAEQQAARGPAQAAGR